MSEVTAVLFTMHHSVFEVAKALEAIEKLNFGADGFDSGFILDEIMAPGGVTALLMDGETVVGYQSATTAEFVYRMHRHYRGRDGQDAAYITNSSIHPDYQHKGHVWLMADKLEAELKAKGYKFLDRDSKADLGYDQKVIAHYGERVVFAKEVEDTMWGTQRYIRILL